MSTTRINTILIVTHGPPAKQQNVYYTRRSWADSLNQPIRENDLIFGVHILTAHVHMSVCVSSVCLVMWLGELCADNAA